AADDALLPPDLALAQLAVGHQAGELGAGAGAAGRTVIRPAGAEHEVAAVGRPIARRAEQLDVVDLLPLSASNAAADERPPDAPGEVGQAFDVRQLQILPVRADQEEPVAAPGHVAGDRAAALDRHGDALR